MRKNTRTYLSKASVLALLFCCGLGLLPSCKSRKEEPPVPEAKMKSILLDLHIAESYSSVVKADSSGKKNLFGKNTDSLALYYKEILSRYNISYNELKMAIDWYQRHPAQMDSVYVGVLSGLDSLKPPPDIAPPVLHKQ